MKSKLKQIHHVRKSKLWKRIFFIISHLETTTAATETLEMGQTNQNVLRLLEEDEKVRILIS